MTALPSHIVVGGLLRAAEARGGNGVILARGDRDAGAVLLILTRRGTDPIVFERLSSLAGGFEWNRRKARPDDETDSVARFIDEKKRFDRDLWIVEVDIADAEQFIVDSLG